MTVPPARVRVPSQRPLAPSVTFVANDKGDNEMIPGAVHRSPGIYVTAEEKTRKPPSRSPLMKAVLPVIASNGVPSIEMKYVASHSTSGREMERKKERIVLGTKCVGYLTSWHSLIQFYAVLVWGYGEGGRKLPRNFS